MSVEQRLRKEKATITRQGLAVGIEPSMVKEFWGAFGCRVGGKAILHTGTDATIVLGLAGVDGKAAEESVDRQTMNEALLIGTVELQHSFRQKPAEGDFQRYFRVTFPKEMSDKRFGQYFRDILVDMQASDSEDEIARRAESERPSKTLCQEVVNCFALVDFESQQLTCKHFHILLHKPWKEHHFTMVLCNDEGEHNTRLTVGEGVGLQWETSCDDVEAVFSTAIEIVKPLRYSRTNCPEGSTLERKVQTFCLIKTLYRMSFLCTTFGFF
ncbi:hypothetical protein BV898_09626 [Hypsibius exemplaris]|uniref:Uncharacterized protein n=1 Tax=Hypsibius exemplaris TaxID=2072580 RepID=A0A1W0WM87_HYPEX|nr:hypothetical protein BV898_09626 [Hypsibius exemplaris]